MAEELGEADGIVIIDETGFLKKGDKSAGVARQYSGTAGRIENQQIGVFLAYTSKRGCAFIDRELYIPEEWFQDSARCLEAGLPQGISFETKPHLAQRMVERAIAAHIPARWVVADTVYGTDALQVWLEAQGFYYVLAVPYTIVSGLKAGKFQPKCLSPPNRMRRGHACQPGKEARDLATMIGLGCSCLI